MSKLFAALIGGALLAASAPSYAQFKINKQTRGPVVTMPTGNQAVDRTNTQTINGVKTTTTVHIKKCLLLRSKKDGTSAIIQKDVKDAQDQAFTCETKTVKVNLADDDFLSLGIAQQASYILPGAAYTYDDFFSGSFRATEAGRSPVNLRITAPLLNPGQSSQITVANPTIGNLNDGRLALFNRLPAKSSTNASYRYKAYEVHNNADLAIAVSGGFNGFGAKISDQFNFHSNTDHRYMMLDITKEFFTINADLPAGRLLQDPKQVADPTLMYMDAVTYGVRVLAYVDITVTNDSIGNLFKGSYNAGAWDISAQVNTILKHAGSESTMKLYVVGGNSSSLGVPRSLDDLFAAIDGAVGKAHNVDGQPIRYSFKNGDGDVITSESATDFFQVKNCVPRPQDDKFDYTIRLSRIMKKGDANIYGGVGAIFYVPFGTGTTTVFGGKSLWETNDKQATQEAEMFGDEAPSMTMTNVPDRLINQITTGRAMVRVFFNITDYDEGSKNDRFWLKQKTGDVNSLPNDEKQYYPKVRAWDHCSGMEYVDIPLSAFKLTSAETAGKGGNDADMGYQITCSEQDGSAVFIFSLQKVPDYGKSVSMNVVK